jgi:site-specific recombinase
VYLFASGVLSGWIDNHAVYTRLEERLRSLPWPDGVREKGERASRFLVDNLGVMAGNVILGFMLGTAGTIGFIFRIPFDIRHIAFSSANFGIAVHAAPELFDWRLVLLCTAGVIGIGFVNFLVSFGMTLGTTLESRQVAFGQWRRLASSLLRRFLQRPGEWFFPPKVAADSRPPQT